MSIENMAMDCDHGHEESKTEQVLADILVRKPPTEP